MTEEEIALEVNVSIATVSRFWNMAGYKNFKEFKKNIKEKLEVSPANKMRNIVEKIGNDDLPGRMVDQHFKYLVETSNHLSRKDFEASIQAISNAETVYVYAPGPSESIGKLFEFRLSRFGLRMKQIPKSGHELFEVLMHIQEKDIVVIYGFVSLLPESKVIFQQAKESHFKTILITDQLISEMNSLADYVLYTCRGEMWEFHSMVPPLAITEALIVGVGLQNKEVVFEKLNQLSAIRKKYASSIPK
jgi:DNA-binding MurR/RpiR family transcriptional regulator